MSECNIITRGTQTTYLVDIYYLSLHATPIITKTVLLNIQNYRASRTHPNSPQAIQG